MRWLTLADDPTAGGTTLDTLEDPVGMNGIIPAPAVGDAVVVTTGQADPGIRNLDRDNNVTGRRAGTPPVSFASAPSMTFGSLAWTSLTKRLIRKGMGGPAVPTGVAPAAISTNVQMAQEGAIPAMIGTLVREEQVDRLTGLWVNELTFNFPADAEGTVEGSLMGLYHDVDAATDVAGLPAIAGNPAQTDAYMLRDVVAYLGAGAGVPIDCLGGFGWTLNNNLSEDFRTRFCAGRNILDLSIDGDLHRLWYPDRNKLGRQTITGRLDFGDTRPDRELRRLVTHAEKLVVELTGPPIPGAVPAADDMTRLIFWKQAPTGGGAEPLARDGDQQSSYEFTAYLDDVSGKDLEAVLLGATAIA